MAVEVAATCEDRLTCRVRPALQHVTCHYRSTELNSEGHSPTPSEHAWLQEQYCASRTQTHAQQFSSQPKGHNTHDSAHLQVVLIVTSRCKSQAVSAAELVRAAAYPVSALAADARVPPLPPALPTVVIRLARDAADAPYMLLAMARWLSNSSRAFERVVSCVIQEFTVAVVVAWRAAFRAWMVGAEILWAQTCVCNVGKEV